MPINPSIALQVQGLDPNGFINALAAGQKQRELQNASDRLDLAENRLARKDEAVAADRNALASYLSNPRTPEADKAFAIASPEGYLKTRKALDEADNNAAQAKSYQLENFKKNAAIVAEATGAMLANPTRENVNLILDDAEAKGADVSTPRKQLEKAPDEAIVGYIKGWAANATKIHEMTLADEKAKPKPVRNTYNNTWEYPPGSAPPATGAGAEPTAPGGQGSSTLTQTEDPTYRYFKNRHGFSDLGAFVLSRNITQESGHRTDVKGDGGKGQGLAQWHPPRWAKLEKWATENGLDPNSKQAQMDYIAEEVKSYPGWESLQGNDPEALKVFMKNYEGYGVEGTRFSGVDERASQGGAAAPPTASVPPPADGQPAPVQPTPPSPPPTQFKSRADLDAANFARQGAKDAEAHRIAQERLELEKRRTTAQEARVMPGGQPKLTEAQGKATAFAMRGTEANQQLDAMESGIGPDGKPVADGPYRPNDGTTVGKWAGGMTGSQNRFLTPTGQRYEQAKLNFLTAVLRLESGAAIPPGEIETGNQQYFALPGESDEVIAQKKQNRATAMKAMDVVAGPGRVGSGAPAAPTGPAAPVQATAQPDRPAPQPVKVAPLAEFEALPMPGEWKGKDLTDTKTGIRYYSDGRNWIKK